MRAAVVEAYGPPEVVRVVEVPTPSPRRGQVRVRVRASAVSSGDARIRGARFPAGFGPLTRLAFGVRRPRRPVLGGSYAGEVDAVGEGVTTLRRGDRVAGMTGLRLGTHAEQVVVRADTAVPVPDGVTTDDAAAVLFGGSTALHFLRDKAGLTATTGAGRTALVVGASGAVGSNAVQLARHAGAEVTAVCSGRNEDLVRGLGAAHLVDHTTTPLTDLAAAGARFDVVLDTVGVLSPRQARGLLADDGAALLVVATLGQSLRAVGRVRAGAAPERPADLAQLLDLVAAGDLRVVVDDVLGLDEIVAAHRRVDTGRKRGNLVLHP